MALVLISFRVTNSNSEMWLYLLTWIPPTGLTGAGLDSLRELQELALDPWHRDSLPLLFSNCSRRLRHWCISLFSSYHTQRNDLKYTKQPKQGNRKNVSYIIQEKYIWTIKGVFKWATTGILGTINPKEIFHYFSWRFKKTLSKYSCSAPIFQFCNQH